MNDSEERVNVAAKQYLYKPIGAGRVAILLINSDTTTATLTADFSKIPGLTCSVCKVRDIWNHKDLGVSTGSMDFKVDSHDCAFLVVSP